jgi:hypothetical protein
MSDEIKPATAPATAATTVAPAIPAKGTQPRPRAVTTPGPGLPNVAAPTSKRLTQLFIIRDRKGQGRGTVAQVSAFIQGSNLPPDAKAFLSARVAAMPSAAVGLDAHIVQENGKWVMHAHCNEIF